MALHLQAACRLVPQGVARAGDVHPTPPIPSHSPCGSTTLGGRTAPAACHPPSAHWAGTWGCRAGEGEASQPGEVRVASSMATPAT